MQRKTTLNKYFFLILILFLFFLLSDFALAKKCTTDVECAPAKCVDEKCVRALELKYPIIPGATATPETVAIGLPEYANYIFQFAIVIIGLIIFGVLVYNGVIYLTSAGDPSKMTDARAGIFAGFLGAIILLSAYLIFHTINPQLTILKMEEIPALKPIVFPGIYICANKVDDIEGVLNKYLQGEGDRVEVVEELRKIIEEKTCLKANFSGNFENFEVSKNNNTFFVIPTEESEYDSDKATTTTKYVSEYGLILHEKDNFSGRCSLAFQENDKIYASSSKETFKAIENFNYGNFSGLDFTARSFTLFKKPDPEPFSAAKGVTLYTCIGYDQTGCAEDAILDFDDFKPGFDMKNYYREDLLEHSLAGDPEDPEKGARSIQIDPKGSFLAVILDEDNSGKLSFEAKEKCEVISSNVVDLTQHPIGRCGNCIIGFWSSLNPFNWGKECYPCIQSMTVIKGLKL